MTLFNNRREQKRFVKFGIVGAIGSVVDFGVFNLCVAAFGFAPMVAQAISFAAAVASNFILNRYWTFPDARRKRLSTQVWQYLLVNLIGLLIRTPVFNAASSLLIAAFGSQVPLGLPPDTLAHNLALAIAIGVVMLWNYFVNRYWTFGDVE